MKTAGFALFGLVTVFATTACFEESLTREEAQVALDELTLEADMTTLTSSSIELTTSFTIGEAAEKAAEEIGSFITSQLPCAEVTLDGATLHVEYGAKPGSCTYRGQTFTGATSVTVRRTTPGELVVEHDWDALSNGRVKVSGSATVTWSSATSSRHVVHNLVWTRLEDGYEVRGAGDRTQRPLSGGIEDGFMVDGSRSWTSPRGTWSLDIDSVEMRWIDPVPQAGTYTLETPFDGKEASVSFERVGSSRIQVTFESGNRDFDFDVVSSR